MQPRLNVITVAVDDLQRSLAFYRDGLGLPTKGIIATEFEGTDTEPAGAVVFFELQGGLLFALYPRKELAKDAKRPGPRSRTSPTIGRGASIQVISRISTGISGRSSGNRATHRRPRPPPSRR